MHSAKVAAKPTGLLMMRVSDLLFFAGFACFVFQGFLETTMFMEHLPESFTMIFKGIALSFVLFKVLVFDIVRDIKRAYLAALLLLSCSLVYIATGYLNLVFLAAFAIGAHNVDFDAILKLFLIENVVLIVATSAAGLAGVISNVGVPKDGGVVYSYGFFYTTEFSAHVLFTTLAFLFLKRKDYTFSTLLICFIPTLVVYLLTKGRLSFFLLIGVLVTLVILRYSGEKEPKFSFVFRMSYFLLALVAVLLMINYTETGTMASLNDLLTGRLYYAHQGYQQYGVNLLGQQIEMNGWGGGKILWKEDYFYVDCSYLKILLRFGVVGLLVSLIVCSIPLFRLKKTACAALAILLAVACSSFINEHMIDLAYNVFAVMALSRCEVFSTFRRGNYVELLDAFEPLKRRS